MPTPLLKLGGLSRATGIPLPTLGRWLDRVTIKQSRRDGYGCSQAWRVHHHRRFESSRRTGRLRTRPSESKLMTPATLKSDKLTALLSDWASLAGDRRRNEAAWRWLHQAHQDGHRA